MTRRQKIKLTQKLLRGETETDYKVWIVIVENGIERCDDPGYPDKAKPQDVVFKVIVHNTDEPDGSDPDQ